ncbi:Non-specific lipid-transfer protein [Quillaja saponaria]|uniref:Non-specific lipid-transfer protein n=1 Tax=Quillaja saponaria TaxID=32244 RepID=A0AAD7VCW2_QUISA|nr:Non-specific lipid-transfer protein [Quillaja saponaria]
MTRKVGGVSLFVMVVAMAILFLGEVPYTAEGVTCSLKELSPCLPVITSSATPSALCCQKVREQGPCFCGYVSNPTLGPSLNSPRVRRGLSTCGVTIPTC